MRCSVLQCVAVYCSMLHHRIVAPQDNPRTHTYTKTHTCTHTHTHTYTHTHRERERERETRAPTHTHTHRERERERERDEGVAEGVCPSRGLHKTHFFAITEPGGKKIGLCVVM